MGTAFTHTVDHHAVGAGKRINKRLHGNCAESDFGIGNDNTSLHSVTDTCHFKAMIDNLQIQLILGNLAAHDLHTVLTCEQRQHRRRNFKVIDTAVSVGEECTGDLSAAVIECSDHVAAVFVGKPCVHVIRKKLRLLFLHHVIIPCGDAECRCYLTMEKLRCAEAVIVSDAEGAAVLIQTECLRRTDIVLLCSILTLKLCQHLR